MVNKHYKYKLVYWFYSNLELEEISNKIQDVIEFTDYYRDYENVWEWCESLDKKADIYFDIAREHNWKHGIYECPVILIMKRKIKEYTEDEIKAIGYSIAKVLNISVYYGNINYLYNSNYNYEIKKTFSSVRI